MSALRSARATSAGGVVHRAENGPQQIVLVHRRVPPLWALPKGTPDAGETLEETALRDDENAAMRTAIGAIDAPGMSRMIIGEFAAGHFQHAHIGIFQVPSRTDAVEQNAHFDSGLRAFDQCITKLAPDIVRINNVSFEVDRFLRGANRRKHRRKIFVSILQQLDFVAGDENRIAQGEGGADKFRIAHRETMLDVVGDGVTPDEEETKDDDESDEGERERDPFADGQTPPAIVQPVRRTFSRHSLGEGRSGRHRAQFFDDRWNQFERFLDLRFRIETAERKTHAAFRPVIVQLHRAQEHAMIAVSRSGKPNRWRNKFPFDRT